MQTDPTFAAIVHLMLDIFERHCGSGAGVTPSEIREASGLAWQEYLERHPEPIPVLPREDGR